MTHTLKDRENQPDFWKGIYQEYSNFFYFTLKKWWIFPALAVLGAGTGILLVQSNKEYLLTTSIVGLEMQWHDSYLLSADLETDSGRRVHINRAFGDLLKDENFSDSFALGIVEHYEQDISHQGPRGEGLRRLSRFLELKELAPSKERVIENLSKLIRDSIGFTPEQGRDGCDLAFCITAQDNGLARISVKSPTAGSSKEMVDAIISAYEKNKPLYNQKTSVELMEYRADAGGSLDRASRAFRASRAHVIERGVKLRQQLVDALRTKISPAEISNVKDNPLGANPGISAMISDDLVLNLKWNVQKFFEDGRLSDSDTRVLNDELNALELELLRHNAIFNDYGKNIAKFVGRFPNQIRLLLPDFVSYSPNEFIRYTVTDKPIGTQEREAIFYPLLGLITGLIVAFVIQGGLFIYSSRSNLELRFERKSA